MDIGQMRLADLLSSGRSKLVFFAALAVVAGACHLRESLSDSVSVTLNETQAWNDVMPGAAPKFRAMLHVQLINTSEQDIILTAPEGMIVNSAFGSPLRRFTAELYLMEVRTAELRLRPSVPVDLYMRTPSHGIPPIDTSQSPNIQFVVKFSTPEGNSLLIRGKSTRIFTAQ
jgi:hypothetical protein